MSDYIGQPPHGGNTITHHPECFEDCGHWDCMGCCYCPDEHDAAVVADLRAGEGWLGQWFLGEMARVRADERAKARQRVAGLPWEPHGVMRTAYVNRERAMAVAGGER